MEVDVKLSDTCETCAWLRAYDDVAEGLRELRRHLRRFHSRVDTVALMCYNALDLNGQAAPR